MMLMGRLTCHKTKIKRKAEIFNNVHGMAQLG